MKIETMFKRVFTCSKCRRKMNISMKKNKKTKRNKMNKTNKSRRMKGG